MQTPHSGAYRLFIRKLRAARLRAGLTQAQTARALGRPQSFVSKCESGERRVDVVELAALAQVYGQTLDDFMVDAAPVARKPSLVPEGRSGSWSPSRKGRRRR